MDPLMDENFFIEHPENFENKFHNKGQKFDKSKSKQIIEVMSKRNRHAKKMKQKSKKAAPTK